MDTERNAEFLEILKQKLKPDRLYHSLNVAEEAKKLALHYGADEKKAFTAGLVHDIMKNTPQDEMYAFLLSHGAQLNDVDAANPKIWHAIAGYYYLRDELGVTDADILSAVRWHTTSQRTMTLLEKIIFVADYISAERDYPGVDDMRKKAYISLESAMFTGLSFTIQKCVGQGLPLAEDSLFAYNTLAMELRKQRKEESLCNL